MEPDEIQMVFSEVLKDLRGLPSSLPNERLVQEAQLCCASYRAFRQREHCVWVEKHYHGPPWIGNAGTTCDSVINPGDGDEKWVEFKTVTEDDDCHTHRERWSQVAQRLEDICNIRGPHVRGLSCLLVFFNQPGGPNLPRDRITAVQEFHPDRLFCSPIATNWQWTDTTRARGRTYSNMAIWVWKWPKPVQVAAPQYVWIE